MTAARARIPIFDTIGHGFYFALSKFVPILRITWLPALIAGGIIAVQFSLQLLAERGAVPELGYLPEYYSLLAGTLFYALLAIPAVAVYRMVIFGRRAPEGLAYFRFGGTELQLLASQLVMTVYSMIYLILVSVAVIGGALLAHELFRPSADAVAASADLTGLRFRIGIGAAAVFAAFAYLGAVLLSLVPPFVVAEHRIGIWRSLGTLWLGNALRIGVVWFVVGVTFIFISSAAYALMQALGPLILSYLMPNFDGSNLIDLTIAWAALWLVPFVLIGTLALGVTAGVNGYAYRILILKPLLEQAS